VEKIDAGMVSLPGEVLSRLFRPLSGLALIPLLNQGLRTGLYSYAASRLDADLAIYFSCTSGYDAGSLWDEAHSRAENAREMGHPAPRLIPLLAP